MGETKSALLVANYRYEDPDLRQLIAPAQDAESLARVLADPAIGGFEVRTLVNEPSQKVSVEIENFLDNRKRHDLLLIYFSGHGIKDADGQLYFATVDTQLVQHNVRRATAVSAYFLNKAMSDSFSRRQILLLDCCYSGAFKKGMLARGGKRVGAGEQLEGKGRVVLTASDALQYSFEGEQVKGEGNLSIFTRMLVHGLETGEADLDRDGFFSLDEVYDYVHDRVADEQPEQKPMKMGYVEGRIFIGSNPRPRAAELPPELQESLDDRRPWVRQGAVEELGKLLAGNSRGLVMAAQAALTSMARQDDSQQVRRAAKNWLAAHGETLAAGLQQAADELAAEATERALEEEARRERDRQEGERTSTDKAEPVEKDWTARERAEREKAEAERAAQEKAEKEQHECERVEAERLARGKIEAERKAEEKDEQDRISRERTEAERKATEQAEAERKAQEKAEQEKREHAEAARQAAQRAEAQRKARLEADQEQREKGEVEHREVDKGEAERVVRGYWTPLPTREGDERKRTSAAHAAAERESEGGKAQPQPEKKHAAAENAESKRLARCVNSSV